MENKNKIIYAVSFFLLLGCYQNPNKKTENSNASKSSALDNRIGRIVKTNNKFLFVAPCLFGTEIEVEGYYRLKNNIIHFSRVVKSNSDTLDLKTVIDLSSFKMVGLHDEEKNKIRNIYYLNGRMNCYYKDIKNFYAYVDQESPEFLLLGLLKDMELVGGNYVKVKNEIFSNGLPVISTDIESFHTMDILQEKTEWFLTIGLDKNNMYLNNKVLTEKDFSRLIAPNDSLKRIYFHKKTS